MITIAQWIDTNTGQPLNGTPLGIALSAQAAATPDRAAFTLGNQTWSFAQFDALANQRARDLLRSGVVAGHQVVLAMTNRLEYLQCAFALWKIGATPCPISQRLTDAEFTGIVDLLDAALVIGTQDLPAVCARLYDIDAPLDASLDPGPLPPVASVPGKIANSGGSTGRPKLIVDPLPSVWGRDKEGCRRGPRLTLLNPGPLYHSAPFNTATMALAQGSHIICLDRFDVTQWLTLVARHQVNYAYLVPTMMTRIAKAPEASLAGHDLSSLNTVLHMAAPCPLETKRWWLDRIGADKIWEVYGGTERIGVTMISGEDWLLHPGSVGRAATGQQIEITASDGMPLPQGEVGEIRFRKTDSTEASYAYIGAENRMIGGSDSFGDMGWLDAEGYLYIADRRTDMVLVGGVNIYPAEIEAAAEALPHVLACAVIGLPDADLGNRLHAIIEWREDTPFPPHEAFIASLRTRLSGFKTPRSVEFTHDRLRDDAGKLRRSSLREHRMGPGSGMG